MLIIAPLVLFTLSLFGLIYMISQRLALLRNLDSKLIGNQQHQQIKVTLLEERLKRQLIEPVRSISRHLRPLIQQVTKLIAGLYHNLIAREKSLRSQAQLKKLQKKSSTQKKIIIKEKLLSADESDSQESREDHYIEIISLDPKNIAAYEGLGGLYLEQRDLLNARQVYEHLLKIAEPKVEYFIKLAEIWLLEAKITEAFKTLKNAFKIHTKNPKLIDKIVETAILLKDSSAAKDFLSRLRDINPDNKKIEEYKKSIRKI